MAQPASRLTPHTAQILSLKAAGASFAEIQRWLRARRIRVDESTVRRFWSRVHPHALQSLPDFDAAAEVLRLKAQTKIRRKHSFNQTRSRLDSRTAQILAMKNAGLSAAKIQLALDTKGVAVDESTVRRFLKKQQGKHGLI
ncbi:hypothetical protein [Aeromonas sanarellii]